MFKIKKIFDLFTSKFYIKNINTYDIYNSEIFRSGIEKLLREYKEILINADQINQDKIKEIDFHINILKKASADYLN